MANQFSVGGKGQKQLKKFFKIAPRAFQRTSAGVLNTLAFIAKPGMQQTLKRDNIVRTPSLLKKALKVQKAKPFEKIGQQESRVGSVLTARHDAFEAIDQGTPTKATQFTDAGRTGGTSRGKGKKEGKIGSDVTEENDLKVSGSGDSRTISFLQQIQRDKTRRRKAFFLPRNFKGMKKGIYKFKGGRVGVFKKDGRKFGKTLVGARIVKISERGAKFTPKKTNWNKRTIIREIKEDVVRKAWVSNQQFQLRKVLKRIK